MNTWIKDIQAWISKYFNSSDESQLKKTEKIAIRNGWNPKTYHSSMRKSLHKWLTDWYTLSIKKLETPATLRKNPIKNNYIYTFWFPVKTFALDFSDTFNFIRQTTTLSLKNREDEFNYGWYLELSGPQYDDSKFDEIAVSFGGEYLGYGVL